MDHHWCFPMKSLSVCLKLSGVETHGFPLHQAVEIVSQVGPKHVITLPVEHFGACSLVQNTSQFSTQVMSWPNSRQKVGQAWGFQVSYPRPLFWHLKLLTNSHVTITCSLQPAAIGAAIVPRFVDWAPVLSRYPQWFIVVHPKLHGEPKNLDFSWHHDLDWIGFEWFDFVTKHATMLRDHAEYGWIMLTSWYIQSWWFSTLNKTWVIRNKVLYFFRVGNETLWYYVFANKCAVKSSFSFWSLWVAGNPYVWCRKVLGFASGSPPKKRRVAWISHGENLQIKSMSAPTPVM